jgi:hypothetical protein
MDNKQSISMDTENKISLYNKLKSDLGPKKAVELMFREYDSFCKYTGLHNSLFNEKMYIWKR